MIRSFIRKIPILRDSPRLATFFGVSSVIFVFGFVLFFTVYFLSDTDIVTAQEPEMVSSTGAYIMEVHIANNGMVMLRGAKVESISATSMVVSTSWDNTNFLWTININGSDYGGRHFGTSLFNSRGDKISMSDLYKGNIVSVSGVFNTNQTGPTVKADTIRVSN